MSSAFHLIAAIFLLADAVIARSAGLQRFTDCRLVESAANDGDSFIVQTTNRQVHVRLYFADCPETSVSTDADAKRVREQARHFGLTNATDVVRFGRDAKAFMEQTLAKPFTIHTLFASAMGRSPGGRVYAFVTTGDGKDLAGLLVENGLARAYGMKRSGPDGRPATEIEKQLQDMESRAMRNRAGIWSHTDTTQLARLRAEQSEEDRQLRDLRKELREAETTSAAVDLNTATSGQIQAIPGIGPVLASRIIAGRPYTKVDDLLRVKGIGTNLLEKIRPHVVVNSSPEKPTQ